MRNPWKKVSSLKEAEELSGVVFPGIDSGYIPAGMKESGIFCMNGLIEIRYSRKDDVLILRRSILQVENISGDYNHYPSSYLLPAGDFSIKCRGTKELINTAEFHPFGAYCSISCNPGKPGKGLPSAHILSIAEGMSKL